MYIWIEGIIVYESSSHLPNIRTWPYRFAADSSQTISSNLDRFRILKANNSDRLLYSEPLGVKNITILLSLGVKIRYGHTNTISSQNPFVRKNWLEESSGLTPLSCKIMGRSMTQGSSWETVPWRKHQGQLLPLSITKAL